MTFQCREINVREVSKGQGVEPKTNGKTTPPTDPIQAMGFHRNGLHRTIPRSERSKLPLGNHMPADEHGPPDTHSHKYNGKGTVMEIFEGSGPVTRTTEFDSERQGLEIHVEMVERTTPPNRNETSHVYIVPSPNGWTDRTGKQEYRTDLENSRTPRPERLGRKDRHGRIRNQLEHIHINGIRPIRTELWVHATGVEGIPR